MTTLESGILKELKKGDHAAFERVFEHYSKQLYLFSFSYLKSKDTAEDIVQEVFLKIWNNRASIKTDTSFQSYLFTIALNAVRQHFNKLSGLNEIKHDILISFSNQKQEFDNRDDYQALLDRLDTLIGQMPEKRRVVFIKKKIEGKSMKEISEELDIAVKTVEFHISEAMRFLKGEFEKSHTEGLIFFYLFIR
ncbi:MAG: RNA polymerase sigma factor [Mangrovibacterium sp.]|jgi:RNA polymerase sigma-70 factor (family 1)